MRLRDPRIWLGVLSLLFVVGLFLLDTERATPGPLTSTHAQDPKLTGQAGCEACHGSGAGKMAAACTTCHVEIGEQLAQHTGLHGTRQGIDVAQCALCHQEHHGDAAPLVDGRAFALAGVADAAKFDHGHVDFKLIGRHAQLACKACHPDADVTLLASGHQRFLGRDQQCTSCHADPHQGRFVSACADCHGQEHPFKDIANFVHTDRFPLAGAHAGLECAKCHAPQGPHSVEALGGAGPKPAARTCVDCHASPHAAQFVDNVAAIIGGEPGASCGECHPVRAESFKAESTRMRAELHVASGFALVAPHDEVSCSACHALGAPREKRFAKRTPEDCAACHANPHGDQFEPAGREAPSCVQCHAGAHFTPATFDVAAHARTAFALTGAHAKTACNECHTKHGEQARVFRGTPTGCDACHADAHAGAFAVALAAEQPAEVAARNTCGLCHDTESYAQTKFGAREHDRFTTFPLVEAHAKAACSECHKQRPEPDANGRRFGLAAETFGHPVSQCADCHRDVHAGAFDDPHLPKSTAAGASCGRCHSQTNFAPLAGVFDHGAWTSFALDGAHASASCESCHGKSADAKTSGRALGRVSDVHPGSVERCSTCHLDPHRGEFTRVGDSVDCAQCHSVQSFAVLERDKFDHARWTGFALDGAHASTACEACHVPSQPTADGERRLGHAAGTSCADCHTDPHAGQFVAAGGATDCARCHEAKATFASTTFDHERDSIYKLDAQHKKLACSACHIPCATRGGGKVVRYKPLGTRCADCHGFERKGMQRESSALGDWLRLSSGGGLR
jgi:hypothetical protein